ncbi:MAG: hypothetical protein JW936_10040 [Sedimentisphaerales bacterium]|nr:hypothetical protein [Sedimentisphaerales bacterium]
MSKRRKRTVLLVLVGIVLFLLLGRAVVLRMADYLEELDDNIRQARQELDAAKEEIDQGRIFVDIWQEIGVFKSRPVEEQQTRFTAYLQSLETQRNFGYGALGSPAGRPMDGMTGVQILRYELRFAADLDDLTAFLVSLDTAQRLLRIEQLTMNRRRVQRPDLTYVPRHYELDLPSTRTEILDVTMTIAIPAALPSSETAVREDSRVQ